jgi:hypothetical protein
MSLPTTPTGRQSTFDDAKSLWRDLPNINQMDRQGDHFEAVASRSPSPRQHSTTRILRTGDDQCAQRQHGAKLAENIVVAPVSTEMHCDYCHSDNGEGNEGIATGKVETNILTKHDQEHMAEYPVTYTGRLMDQRPVLCAKCHSSNALGAPGVPGIPSLSRAMHSKHQDEVASNLNGCYSCHPGPQTRCLRDVMSQRGMDCVSCQVPCPMSPKTNSG